MASNPIHVVLYQDAVFEVDDQKMAERIKSARSAVQQRLQNVNGDYLERQQLEDMLHALKVLENERLK